MNKMRYKGYCARVEFSDEDDLFIGRLAGIRDIITFEGGTVADLRAAFQEAVDDYLETCAEMGKPPQKPYSGRVMFRLSPEVHAQVSLAAELGGTSLNQWAEKVLGEAAQHSLSH
ncbi:type II toxin-antitoxin system HicB family antitoxin [Saccharibacter floricola]|uniref:HicB family protein n=1 Tax=Saccharibacter floricola DSM 15669 TaxID=1123227 RepID=A0ABQ0NZC8_9PROT|nr:type II toxin-antitoxin system HicB family antitoxin [Saccharibacter floricola]GBQ07278.1 HicB family protein [Saccharibacter floricola DSM 15669]